MKKILLACWFSLINLEMNAMEVDEKVYVSDQIPLTLDLEDEKQEQSQIADSEFDWLDGPWERKLDVRKPEDDQILFTVQNNLSKKMLMKLTITISDQSLTPHAWRKIECLERETGPNSFLNINQSDCELLSWIINSYNKSNDLPLNCDFMILVGFNKDKLYSMKKYGGMSLGFCYGEENNRFPIGETFVINETQFISQSGKETISFKVSPQLRKDSHQKTEAISNVDDIQNPLMLVQQTEVIEVTENKIADLNMSIDDLGEVKPETRKPENDQILFKVQHNGSEVMPVSLGISIRDENSCRNNYLQMGKLQREMQPNTSLVVKQSDCEFLSWILNSYNSSDDLPLNCDFSIDVGFNWENMFNRKSPYGSGMIRTFGSLTDIANGGGLSGYRFPLGETFVINEEEYISASGKECKSFEVNLKYREDS